MAPRKQPQPLTPKELGVLIFIEEFIQARGVAPSYQEIKEHFGFASFNSVQRYLKQLQDKNYLHIPGGNQKRALQVLNPSNSFSSPVTTTQYPSHTQPTKKETPSVESLSLPLLGRVAAGSPIEAFTDDEFIDVPSSLIRNPAKTFALVVQGQSMIEDGILDGDVIFVQKQSYAHNGETVVAMIENQATVKKFYLHNNEVELRPANSTMSSLRYEPQRVDVQGVVVGLLRRL